MFNPSNSQSVYNIIVTLYYKNEIYRDLATSVYSYEISKNARLNNFNLHLLELRNIEMDTKLLCEDSNSHLTITIVKDTKKILDKEFVIQKVNVVAELKSRYNINLLLLSKEVYNFINLNRFAKASTLNTEQVQTLDKSFQTLSSIMQSISSTYGSKLETHYNDAGIINELYDSIRIPETLNDIQIFEYLFEMYQPYLLNPYFIMDDIFRTDTYDIILINLFNIGNNYEPINVQKISSIRNNRYKYLESEPLADFKNIKRYIDATITLKNNITNEIYRVVPEGEKPKRNITIETTMSVNTFKSKLAYMNKFANYEPTYERYEFDNLDIGDIDFLNVYNLSNAKIYDHTPLVIEYVFNKKNNSTFDLSTRIEFAKIPEKLLSGN